MTIITWMGRGRLGGIAVSNAELNGKQKVKVK